MSENKSAEPNPAPPPAPVPPSTGTEQYISKVVKYIPAPILAGYTSMLGLIAGEPLHVIYLSWAVFGLCLILSPLYVWFVPDSIQDNKDCSKRFHALASIIAFAVWGFALGGPFQLTFDWYTSMYGSLALISTTLLMPLLEKMLMLVGFFKLRP